MKPLSALLFVAMLFSAGCQTAPGDASDTALTVSRLISSGMVAQRDAPIRIWGWGAPGQDVAVQLQDERADATVDPEGRWAVSLAARPAGGPSSIVIESGAERIEVKDVLFGDIWVASGQSNMEWPVARANDAEAEIAAAAGPMIRQFLVPKSWAYEPEERLAGGDWKRADAEHVGGFSAVGYFFARELRREVDVPIGLVHTSWGGSRIEPWMSRETLGMSAEDAQAIRDADQERVDQIRQRIVDALGEVPESDPGLVDGVAHWAAPDLDTASWVEMAVPGLWEQAGYDGLDGIAWYRHSVDLSAAEVAAGGVRLGMGQIDDSDITWLNGVEVGRTENAYSAVREYDIPDSALREGFNALAVRVTDTGGGGGIWGSPDALWLETSAGRRPLEGPWLFQVGEADLSAVGARNQIATLLYNKMIHPILPFPATGFLWYQGESNAGGDDAVAYAGQFTDMISSWRTLWEAPDVPFLFAQLANYMAPAGPNEDSDWAVLRESQAAALELPGVGQAVIIDIGEADDIHPRNKQDVGYRLSLAARHLAYGEDLVYSGPTYRSHRVEGAQIRLEFGHVGGGLMSRSGPLGGFAIAGEDGEFVWADARIDGDTIVASSASIASPRHIRYAWADNPDRANLVNAEGLPASPFRTGR